MTDQERQIRELIAGIRVDWRDQPTPLFVRGQESGLMLALKILTGRPVAELRETFTLDWYKPQADAAIAAARFLQDSVDTVLAVMNSEDAA